MKTRLYATGLPVDADASALAALDLALQRELPAFRVTDTQGNDSFQLIVEIGADDSTPWYAFDRLVGFDVQGLTLREVA